jgi:hypothetical protein
LNCVAATLPRTSPERIAGDAVDPATGRPKPAVKAKPPVMKKPARGSTSEIVRRTSEPLPQQTLSSFPPDAAVNASPK